MVKVKTDEPWRVCDGSGDSRGCDTKVPHDHCVCGLAKAVGAHICELCHAEGLTPQWFVGTDGLVRESHRRYHWTTLEGFKNDLVGSVAGRYTGSREHRGQIRRLR